MEKALYHSVFESRHYELLLKGLESIEDHAIIILDARGYIQSWNVGARRIKGYSSEQIIGSHFSIFYSDEDVKAGKPELELQVSMGPRGQYRNTEWSIRKDGSKFWADITITPVRNSFNEVIGFTRVTRDISDKKKIEDLEDSIRIRDEFISVASHELRTPVTKILLNLQLIKRTSEELQERAIKSLDMCESSTKELIGLMDNLIDVARLRLGKLQIRRTKTNITNIILNVITKHKDSIRISGNHLSFNHPGDIVGYWDQTRLDQLFTNLLSNAIKYGEGKPIKIELIQEDDQILFSISDEGPGIPYNSQPKVFERFERAIDSSNISGLGLGLYVARQIVVAHKGDISLESRPGKGAKFIVSLPLKQTSKKKNG